MPRRRIDAPRAQPDQLKAYRFSTFRFRSHALVSCVFWVALGVAWVSLVAPDHLSRAAAAAAGIALTGVVAQLLARHSRRVSRWLAFLGAIALPIYLAHILAGSGVRILLHKGLGVDAVWLHLVLGLVAGVLLPWAFWAITTLLGQGWLWALPVGGRSARKADR